MTTYSASFLFGFRVTAKRHYMICEKEKSHHRRLLCKCQNMVWIHMHWVLCWHKIQNKDHKSKRNPQGTKHAASLFSQIRLCMSNTETFKKKFGFSLLPLRKNQIHILFSFRMLKPAGSRQIDVKCTRHSAGGVGWELDSTVPDTMNCGFFPDIPVAWTSKPFHRHTQKLIS